MKIAISIIFILSSLVLYAQQDGYIDAFSLTYSKLQEASQEYENYSADNKIDKSCEALAEITHQYRTLLKIYDEVAFKFRHDASFDTLVQPIYLAVFEEVEALFVSDTLLVQMQAMVQVMVDTEREGFPKNDDEVKQAIEALYFQDYYHSDFLNNTLEGGILRKQLQGMRTYISRKYGD
ncbi:MAG: hypothetical protein LBH91_03930 [Prevotellaceae bacterium]|jgi:hypothetical protein|nr:hypothetical protein [Prevotellaceae bacterium]